MSIYQFANENGEIIESEYTKSMSLSSEDVLAYLKSAFDLFPYKTRINRILEQDDVFFVDYINKEYENIYICAKGTTPGGRNNLKNEQRIQPKSRNLNYIYTKKENKERGIYLGIYVYKDTIVLCTWKVVKSNAQESTTPVSKQIKITTISKAIKEGFVQQEKGHGEYACAFKPEFLYFYLNNSDWLHEGKVNELVEHTKPEPEILNDDMFHTSYISDLPRNRIIFGAPGTGKSFICNKESKKLLKDGGYYERVTFHPDYSYANFVGTYKPVPIKDKNGNDLITYKYVPGPFMRVYVKAMKSGKTTEPTPNLLIIEEINRANVAAVFGDVFQLLDRKENISEYPIVPSEAMKEFLASELGGNVFDYNEIKIPNNMFIWATMNSADQGVFPMDTAFKRRWDFTYIGIDDAENSIDEGIIERSFIFGKGTNARQIKWNEIRKAINDELSSEQYNINEDKMLGLYFVSNSVLQSSNEEFLDVFKNKVLMYLFDDVVKHRRKLFFENCRTDTKGIRYSEICDLFDEKGIFIFPTTISSKFIDKIPEQKDEI